MEMLLDSLRAKEDMREAISTDFGVKSRLEVMGMQVVGSDECRICVASWDKAVVGLQ